MLQSTSLRGLLQGFDQARSIKLIAIKLIASKQKIGLMWMPDFNSRDQDQTWIGLLYPRWLAPPWGVVAA